MGVRRLVQQASRAWRLATWLILAGVGLTILCSSVGGWLLREQLHAVVLRSFSTELQERAERLRFEFETVGLGVTRGGRFAQGDFGRIFSGWYWVLERGDELWQSRSAWDAVLDPAQAHPWPARPGSLSLTGPQGQALLGVQFPVQLEGRPAQLTVFGPLAPTLTEWQRIDRVLVLTQLCLVVALLIGTILVVRWGLRPLRRLQQQLGQTFEGERDRLGTGFGPDLDPLAGAVDAVLQRNAQMVARAQHQAADLSHALKKPLAVLALQARHEQVDGLWLGQQVQAMSHTIDRHLARFGSGADSQEWLLLAPVLQRLVGVMRQLHESRALVWTLTVAETLRWRGTASDLEEMAGNLLDNAGKWAHGRVTLQVRRQADGVWLSVEDDGPGLSAAQIPLALERGRRCDEQVAGHGLGLAIVQDIAQTYGGSLTLQAAVQPSGSGHGLRCVLHLP